MENVDLIVPNCIAHNRYCDRSVFSLYQRVYGITPRMPRSLTNDDVLETSDVAEGPALGYQRAHDYRIAATTAFFEHGREQQGCQGQCGTFGSWMPKKVVDWVMLHRYSRVVVSVSRFEALGTAAKLSQGFEKSTVQGLVRSSI